MDPYSKPGAPGTAPPPYSAAVHYPTTYPGQAYPPQQAYPAPAVGQPYPQSYPAAPQPYPTAAPQSYPATAAPGQPYPPATQPTYPATSPPVAAPAPIPVAQPAAGVWSLLTHGNKVQLVSAASGKTLRILDNGSIDGNGHIGTFAQFIVERNPSSDVLVLKHVHRPANCLGIHDGRLVALPIGSPQAQLRVHVHADQKVSLESILYPSQHVGVMPNGTIKPPPNTRRGFHGQFTIRLPPTGTVSTIPTVSHAAPPPGAVVSTPGAPPLFWHGNRIQLLSKATGKALRIKADYIIDGHGGGGKFAQFTVEHRRENIFCLRNVHNPSICVCIRDNILTVGNGDQFCELRATPIASDYVTLESVVYPSQHVGILPNGSYKPPSNTRKGPHGQFLVTTVQ